jgi:two-component system, cell cycle sensor histidine kinase and response regulator CckA
MPCCSDQDSPSIQVITEVRGLTPTGPLPVNKELSVPLGTGNATILVVDDEIQLRTVIVRQLRSEGYNVLEAGYGLEALDVARSSPEPVDLVLSDIVMPGMIGTELAQRLLAEHPGIQVVLMSAHIVDELARPDQRWDVPVLRKPFEGRKMLAYVNLMLTNTPARGFKALP